MHLLGANSPAQRQRVAAGIAVWTQFVPFCINRSQFENHSMFSCSRPQMSVMTSGRSGATGRQEKRK